MDISERRFLPRLLLSAFALRVVTLLLLNTTGAVSALTLSKDTGKYHHYGIIIAKRLSSGIFEWSSWIDNGWYQFVGLVYWIFGPAPFAIQLFNIAMSTATVFVVYRTTLAIYHDHRAARISGLFVAIFPSFVYYSTLLQKDTVAILAISLLVLNTSLAKEEVSILRLLGIIVSLAILLSVRDYLFIVCTTLSAISLVLSKDNPPIVVLIRATLVLVVIGFIGHMLGLGFLGIGHVRSTQYFDLAFINDTRQEMTAQGSGAIFDESKSVGWGSEAWSNVRNAGIALYFFFFTLDLTDLGSVRQIMALPEVIAFILLLPALVGGVYWSWKSNRWKAMPLLVFVAGLILVYGAATTNMGAMYRWRMQAMPLLLVLVAYGLVRRRRSWVARKIERLARLGISRRLRWAYVVPGDHPGGGVWVLADSVRGQPNHQR